MAADLVVDLTLKAIGTVGGSILALSFQPPKDRAEWIYRSVFSLLSGALFADATHDYLKWPQTWQMDIASAAATAMLSWFLMGAVVRFINVWKPPVGK